ncbi:hypothetical protein QFC20_000537 [Naganishia adeliensis]|uniref:Uncharacterized protein n=1 Tax=Naganishia adeliensis TaxID=92952 RepID=A0ACC2WXX0_9TREE|nr:hypothetical protein QFC20_000537 [Naganishia adeliensis]
MSRPAARLLGLAPKLTRPNSTTTTPSSLQRLLSAPPQNLLIPSSSTIPRSLNALHQPIPAAQSPQHVHINHPDRLFSQRGPAEWPQVVEQNSAQVKEKVLRGLTGLDVDELRGLTRYTVVLKRVVNMTKKGKMPSFFSIVVVGSPSRGLVGMGQGRGDTAPTAIDGAFHQAVLSMDFVDRFEKRTLWGVGKNLQAKWGSTTVIMRGRPAGFGLAVPPALHRIFTACGIRDASATIEGSRNPMNTLKAALQILHGGAAMPGFGDGTGKKGARGNKGVGMRSREEIEAERGRWGVEVGRRL